MVTGRKPARAYADMAAATPGSIGLAIGCLVVRTDRLGDLIAR